MRKNELDGMTCAIVHCGEAGRVNGVGNVGRDTLGRQVLEKLVCLGGVVGLGTMWSVEGGGEGDARARTRAKMVCVYLGWAGWGRCWRRCWGLVGGWKMWRSFGRKMGRSFGRKMGRSFGRKMRRSLERRWNGGSWSGW